MPLNPALGKQRQRNLSEFKTHLLYIESSRTAGGGVQKLKACVMMHM